MKTIIEFILLAWATSGAIYIVQGILFAINKIFKTRISIHSPWFLVLAAVIAAVFIAFGIVASSGSMWFPMIVGIPLAVIVTLGNIDSKLFPDPEPVSVTENTDEDDD